MTNLLKSAFLCCPVFFLTACGGFTELDSVANVAVCNLPTIGAAGITPDRTMYAKAGGNLSCSGSLENGICYGGYAIRSGKSGDGCIDLNTNEASPQTDEACVAGVRRTPVAAPRCGRVRVHSRREASVAVWWPSGEPIDRSPSGERSTKRG